MMPIIARRPGGREVIKNFVKSDDDGMGSDQIRSDQIRSDQIRSTSSPFLISFSCMSLFCASLLPVANFRGSKMEEYKTSLVPDLSE
jgi:hypothetical protein